MENRTGNQRPHKTSEPQTHKNKPDIQLIGILEMKKKEKKTLLERAARPEISTFHIYSIPQCRQL